MLRPLAAEIEILALRSRFFTKLDKTASFHNFLARLNHVYTESNLSWLKGRSPARFVNDY